MREGTSARYGVPHLRQTLPFDHMGLSTVSAQEERVARVESAGSAQAGEAVDANLRFRLVGTWVEGR